MVFDVTDSDVTAVEAGVLGVLVLDIVTFPVDGLMPGDFSESEGHFLSNLAGAFECRGSISSDLLYKSVSRLPGPLGASESLLLVLVLLLLLLLDFG